MSKRLWIVVATGAIALGGVPVESASADRIVFVRSSNQTQGGIRIWAMQSNGRRLHRLGERFGRGSIAGLHQSRDGRKLVWIRSSGSAPTNALVVANRAAAHPRVVYKKTGRSAPGLPRWSPSGRSLAFGQSSYDPATEESIYRVGVLNPRSGTVRQFDGLTLGGWAPDGRTIVGSGVVPNTVACQPTLLSPNCSPTQDALKALDTQTGALRTILAFADQGAPPYQPSWSPDGSLIAFSRRTEGLFTQLWVVRPDGGGLRQVTTLPYGALDPSWSPDGRKLAFLGGTGKISSTGYSSSYIATIAVDGSGLKRLTPDELHIGSPDWGP